MWLSRRMPRRSISCHEGTLSEKHAAVTRRRPSWSKQISSSAVTASVPKPWPWCAGASTQPMSASVPSAASATSCWAQASLSSRCSSPTTSSPCSTTSLVSRISAFAYHSSYAARSVGSRGQPLGDRGVAAVGPGGRRVGGRGATDAQPLGADRPGDVVQGRTHARHHACVGQAMAASFSLTWRDRRVGVGAPVAVDQRRHGLVAAVDGHHDLRGARVPLDVDHVVLDALTVQLALQAVAVATPGGGVHREGAGGRARPGDGRSRLSSLASTLRHDHNNAGTENISDACGRSTQFARPGAT